MRLAILTNSFDASSAIIANLVHSRGGTTFQIHTDLLTEYRIAISLGGFKITDPIGSEMELADFDAIYVRKPWRGGAAPEVGFPEAERAFVRAQFHAITDELISLSRDSGKLRLVEPATAKRCGKFLQMTKAAQYFEVAPAEVTLNVKPMEKDLVAKTLAAELIGTDRFLFVDRIDPDDIDLAYPWFTQKHVGGDHDVTAAYVGGVVFWFRNKRHRANGLVDWRENINTESEDVWVGAPEFSRFDESVCRLMADLGLLFGRLDFIARGLDLWFLEVNPNGQFAWLDLEDPFPVHTRVLDCLSDPAFAVR